MTGLMYHRPNDYLNYLQDCLEKVKRQGLEGVRWDMFLGAKATTPPPPAVKRGEENLTKYQPLPGIDSIKARIQPNASIICVLAGPGVDKSSYSSKLINHYPSFVHLSMGELLRNRAKLESKRKGSKWPNAVKQINSGELLPQEMVLESLIWNLNQHANATGFIIDGFPRTGQQYEELKNQVSVDNIACVLLIDATEDYCKQRLIDRGQPDEFWSDHEPAAVDTRICLFKLQTLPVCKLADADGKLRVVDGEIKADHVLRDIRTVCEYVLSGKVTGPATKPTPGTAIDKSIDKSDRGLLGCAGQPPVFDIPRVVPTFVDAGRAVDLCTCPIILLFGGPGSGRTDQAEALCERLPGLTHFNVTEFLRNRVLSQLDEDSQKDWDVVARRVHSSSPPMEKDRLIPEYWNVQVDILRQEFNAVAENARAVVIEGFPNDEEQLNIFNQHIGGVDLAILLDCEENTLQKRLLDRYSKLSRNEDEEIVSLHRILFFKHCTLPVIRHYDERSLLVTVPADREQSLVLNDVVTVVEYFLGKQEPQGNNSAASEPSFTSHSLPNSDAENPPPPASNSPSSEKLIDQLEITAVNSEQVQSAQALTQENRCNSDYSSSSTSNNKVIFVTGKPNCGKTTQCGYICSHFGFKYCAFDPSGDNQQSVTEIIRALVPGVHGKSFGVLLDGLKPTNEDKKWIASELNANCIEIELTKSEGASKKQESHSRSSVMSKIHSVELSDDALSNLVRVHEITVDASGTVDETFEQIRKFLENL